jgi:hypothetical protein
LREAASSRQLSNARPIQADANEKLTKYKAYHGKFSLARRFFSKFLAKTLTTLPFCPLTIAGRAPPPSSTHPIELLVVSSTRRASPFIRKSEQV